MPKNNKYQYCVLVLSRRVHILFTKRKTRTKYLCDTYLRRVKDIDQVGRDRMRIW